MKSLKHVKVKHGAQRDSVKASPGREIGGQAISNFSPFPHSRARVTLRLCGLESWGLWMEEDEGKG